MPPYSLGRVTAGIIGPVVVRFVALASDRSTLGRRLEGLDRAADFPVNQPEQTILVHPTVVLNLIAGQLPMSGKLDWSWLYNRSAPLRLNRPNIVRM